MILRFRFAPRDLRPVDARDGRCPLRRCFQLHRHTIRSAAGASGCSSRTTEEWECATRDRRGCPPEGSAALEPADPQRFRRRRGAWEEAPA